MNYELALKLKGAGFPQREYPGTKLCEHGLGDSPIYINDVLHYCYQKEKLAYAPTLSELIEACGEQIDKIQFKPIIAFGRYKDGTFCDKNGSSPEEAVANLWLVLNKK